MTPEAVMFLGTIIAMGIMGFWIYSWVNDLLPPMDPKDPKKKGDK